MHTSLDIKVEYAFALAPIQKHDPLGKVWEKYEHWFPKGYFILHYIIASLVFPPSENQMYNNFLQVFWARFRLQMHFIIAFGGVPLYLKLKKLNKGVTKNFPKYSKLMLCSLLLGSYIQILIGQWSGVQEIFSRLSLVYTGWFNTWQLEVWTSFFNRMQGQ